MPPSLITTWFHPSDLVKHGAHLADLPGGWDTEMVLLPTPAGWLAFYVDKRHLAGALFPAA